MGRKSLATERREQILSAFATCLDTYGFEGCSLERIAQQAGVQRSIIRHYIGNRDDLITAAVQHIVSEYKAKLEHAFENFPQPELIPELFNFLFEFEEDSANAGSFHDNIIDTLWATQKRNPHTRTLLHNLYVEYETLVFDCLSRAYPNAAAEECRQAAHGIIGLTDSTWSMISIGFPKTRLKSARSMAEQLVAALASA